MKGITKVYLLRTKIKFLIIYTCFVLLLVSFSSAAFIDTGYSARIKGMGDVFCAIADQAETIYYNPAGLDTISAPQISLSYQLLWTFLTEQDTLNKGFITGCLPIKKFGSIGISYTNFNTSGIYQENTASLTYSRLLAKNFYFGLTGKYLSITYLSEDNPYFNLYGNTISNFAVDFGLLYKTEKFSFGISGFNLNQPQITLNQDEEGSLAISVKTGVGIKLTDTFTLATDINYNDTLKLCVGIEKVFSNEGISIRTGSNYDLLGSAEVSVGFGYRIPVSFGGINLSYSFSYPITTLSNIIGHHLISLLIDFKTEQPSISKQEKPQIVAPQQQDVKQIKEEITKTLQAQKIKLTISKEVIKKEDKEVVFNVDISTDIKVSGWQLVIQDQKQRLVKKFYSTQQSQTLTWDLKTEEGSIIPVGKYTYYVIGVDAKDNKIQSELKTLIVAEKPQQQEQTPQTIICPNCGSEVMKGERFCPVCREPLPKE